MSALRSHPAAGLESAFIWVVVIVGSRAYIATVLISESVFE